jgi:hypothetical protein
VNLPSVTIATVPQRAMHRLQYPRTCRTFGISADMHKLPRGNENSVWPQMAAVSRRSPSKYQAAAIKLSAQAVF